MKRQALTVALAALVATAFGCGDDDSHSDGAVPDAAQQQDSGADAQATDAQATDAQATDAQATDAQATDAQATDAGLPVDAAVDSGPDGSATPILDGLLAALRSDPQAAMQTQSDGAGWPAPVEGGWLFVSLDLALNQLGGDHEGWQGQAMNPDQGFHWLIVAVADGTRYKFTDGTTWESDPWSRAYEWDSFGIMSMVPPTGAHLERFFNLSDTNISARTIRVWVPAGTATHVLYVQDGQNLFNPNAMWGGWQLDAVAPAGMMLVGIDNSPARMDEYTHVPDDLGTGPIGGQGDDYADFVHVSVRALITAAYGEPPTVGLMGSSLGGLITFHIAARYPGAYDYAASLSGTMGWGSIGAGIHNETMIERYLTAGHGATALYLDSGGGGTCVDIDGDGIEDDDPAGSDNYCENKQLESVLYSVGYTANVDVWHWHESGASHNEAAWAARVWRPLDHFATL